jgi:hypothetical protein
MKTILKLSLVLLIITALLLPSCNSGLSITKRRYNKGYYVEHFSKKHAQQHSRENLANANRQKNNVKNNEYNSKTFETNSSEPASVSENNVITANAAPAANKAAKKAEKSISNKSESLIPVEFIKDPAKSFRSLTEKINKDGPVGAALSLLWILIVILLVVYIAGLLLDNFGLGWAIHILLVVILVLFILWLLRIL